MKGFIVYRGHIALVTEICEDFLSLSYKKLFEVYSNKIQNSF